MSETDKTSEEYWGSTIHIATEKQADGTWQATATVGSATAPLQVRNQATQEAARAAVRSLAAGSIDAQRVSHGKP